MDEGTFEVKDTVNELVISKFAVTHDNNLYRVLLANLNRIDSINASKKTVLSSVNLSEIKTEDTHESIEITVSH